MKINSAFRSIARFAMLALLAAIVFAIPVFAQTAPAPATAAGKFVLIAIGVAAAVQALKGVVNNFWPNVIKGRVAVVLSILATVSAYFVSVDVHTITFYSLALGIFSSSGVFASVQAIFKGQN